MFAAWPNSLHAITHANHDHDWVDLHIDFLDAVAVMAPMLTDKPDKLADAEAAEKAATARAIDFNTVFIVIFLGRLSS